MLSNNFVLHQGDDSKLEGAVGVVRDMAQFEINGGALCDGDETTVYNVMVVEFKLFKFGKVNKDRDLPLDELPESTGNVMPCAISDDFSVVRGV